jgi:hypothetical protein
MFATALALLAISSSTSLRDDPQPPGRLLQIAALATERRDREAIAQAMTPDGLENPPEGYQWVLIHPSCDFNPMPGHALRTVEKDGATRRLVLVTLKPTTVTEADLRQVFKKVDERWKPAMGVQFSTEGGKKMSALTRAYLPDNDAAIQFSVAIIVRGEVRSAPVIRTEVREQAIIESFTSEQEVDDLIRDLQKVIDEDKRRK